MGPRVSVGQGEKSVQQGPPLGKRGAKASLLYLARSVTELSLPHPFEFSCFFARFCGCVPAIIRIAYGPACRTRSGARSGRYSTVPFLESPGKANMPAQQTWQKRMLKEMRLLQNEPIDGICLYPHEDNLLLWEARIGRSSPRLPSPDTHALPIYPSLAFVALL